MTTIGTLYGLGVGPGDPELLTLKAVRILGRVDTVFAASSSKNEYSLSYGIVSPHLRPETEVVRLGFPMTRDEQALREAWEENARIMYDVLGRGRDAAFVTLGDPLMYSTFGYACRTLLAAHPEIPVRVVPGVASFQAAAARTGRVLGESGQNFMVVSGVGSPEKLARDLACADNLAILKTYRNFKDIRQAIREAGREGQAVFVSRLGHEGEVVETDLDKAPDKPHYLSLILLTGKKLRGG